MNATDLLLDLADWSDPETGLQMRLGEIKQPMVGFIELLLEGQVIGSLTFQYLETENTMLVVVADFGPLAEQGVASRYYEWAVPLIRDAGVAYLSSSPRGAAERMLISKGWSANTVNQLGHLMLAL